MTAEQSLRRVARTVLPRRALGRLGDLVSHREQRSRERKLATACDEFERAYGSYWETGVVPPEAEELLFLATWSSGGTFPRSCANRFATPFAPGVHSEFTDDLLARLDPSAVARGVQDDGFYVAPFRLDEAAVVDVLQVLEAGPAQPRGDGLGPLAPGVPTPIAPTWWMHPSQSLTSAAARRLLGERRLAEVGGHYLGADPMIMSVVLWKSFAWASPDRNSAQQFHFDNDRASFIKMFVYLTDVDEHNGPHTYVLRSHHEKPTELLHGRRLSDRDVARFYPEDGWMTITGKTGTIFFADTQGFHKGGHVTTGERAMFQINLATDRFGVPEAPIGTPADAPSDLAALVGARPRYFSQLFTPERGQP